MSSLAIGTTVDKPFLECSWHLLIRGKKPLGGVAKYTVSKIDAASVSSPCQRQSRARWDDNNCRGDQANVVGTEYNHKTFYFSSQIKSLQIGNA